MGIGTGPGALATGASIGAVTSGWATPVAVVVGAAALTALAGATAWRAQRDGTTAVQLAGAALGSRLGPPVMALLLLVGIGAWTGFYIGLSSRALGGYLEAPPAALALAVGAGLWAVYRSGFRNWNVLVALTGAAATAAAVLTYIGVPDAAPDVRPAPGAATALLGAGFVVAYVAGTLLVTLTLFVGLGAALFARAGDWDLATLTNETRHAGAAVAFLVVSVVAPSVSGMHSGALSLPHLVRAHPRVGAVAMVTSGMALGAVGFDQALLPFLGVLGAVVPPVLATVLLRSHADPHWHAWTAWALGAGAATAAWAAGWQVHVVVGLAVAAGAILVLSAPRRLAAVAAAGVTSGARGAPRRRAPRPGRRRRRP